MSGRLTSSNSDAAPADREELRLGMLLGSCTSQLIRFSDNRLDKMNGSVPGALANSMGREKKPFTYLPGGIDFSELKSPKMQKRINKHLEGSGQSADQTATTSMPFGPQQQSQSTNNSPAPARGHSLPRSLGSSNTVPNKQKSDFKKQGSITNLLSMTSPDPPPTQQKQSPPKPEPAFYNPYAPKKPTDDSMINYSEINGTPINGNHNSLTNGKTVASAIPPNSTTNNFPGVMMQPMISNPPANPSSVVTTPVMAPMPSKAPVNSQNIPIFQPKPSVPIAIPPKTQIPTNQSSTPPPPPPPPPPQWDEETQAFKAPSAKASKVMNVHAQLHQDKQQKLEIQRQEELERKRLEELERQRLEELERKRLEELERKRQEELERQRQEELERQRQEELERQRQRQEELLRQKIMQEELERQRQEELLRQKIMQEELERQKQEELKRKKEFERQKQLELEKMQQQEEMNRREQQKKLELERQKQLELEKQIQSGQQNQVDEDEYLCDPSYFSFESLDELELLRQQQEELKKLEELQRLKLEELNRLKEEERKREEQIKRLQSKSALENRKRQELEQYMKEELQRQQALTSSQGMHQVDNRTDQQEQSQGQQRKQYDVPDFARNSIELLDAQTMHDFDKASKELSSKTNESPVPYFQYKDTLEPMELYEELPSEVEMGVSAYEIDRARFKDRVKPNGVSRTRGHATPPLPPPSPTGGKKGRRTLSSPKPNPADQYKVADQLRLEQEQQLLRELQKEEEMRYLEQMGKQKQMIEARKQQLILEEQRKQDEELRREELRKREEQKRLQQQREEEQRILVEEQRRQEEQIRRQEEQIRLQSQREEEQKRKMEEQRIREEQIRVQQQEQIRIQQHQQQEQIRIQQQREEERRQIEEKRFLQQQEDQKRFLEEQKVREEQKRLVEQQESLKLMEEQQQLEVEWRRAQAEAAARQQEEINQRLAGGIYRPPQTFDLLNRPFFSPPPVMPPSNNFFHSSDFFTDDPFGEPQILQPIFGKQDKGGPAQRSSNNNTEVENVSRIIPIQVDKGVGAFNELDREVAVESPSSLNTLQELQQHQTVNKAEESIRGFTKPKMNNSSSGSGFADVMKDMKANPSFAQREKDTSVHSVESIPKRGTEGIFQPPKLKPVRQTSLPESNATSIYNRRSSEPTADFLNQTRKNVAAELDSVGDTKNRRPSNMFGPKKTPSQSPYMKLLNRALSKSENSREGSQEFVEGTAISREYNGEEGRYMPPPKHKEKEMEDIEV